MCHCCLSAQGSAMTSCASDRKMGLPAISCKLTSTATNKTKSLWDSLSCVAHVNQIKAETTQNYHPWNCEQTKQNENLKHGISMSFHVVSWPLVDFCHPISSVWRSKAWISKCLWTRGATEAWGDTASCSKRGDPAQLQAKETLRRSEKKERRSVAWNEWASHDQIRLYPVTSGALKDSYKI